MALKPTSNGIKTHFQQGSEMLAELREIRRVAYATLALTALLACLAIGYLLRVFGF